MKKKHFLALYVTGVLLYTGLAVIQNNPGYMDAQYYYAGALQLANHHGFVEPYIWNYMNIRGGLPVPAFLYWMPGSSLLAALGLIIFRSDGYLAARFPYILIAALVPVITVIFVKRFTGQKKWPWLAGVIALAAGYYLPFISQTDTFIPYFIFGAVFFLLTDLFWKSGTVLKYRILYAAGLGIISGAMHITRADGIIWLAAAFIVVMKGWFDEKKYSASNRNGSWKLFLWGVIVITGYLLVMGAWYGRNMVLFGSLFPPDNSKNLLLTSYNDLFIYPTSLLTFQRLMASGFIQVLLERIKAAGINLENVISVFGEIFLFPFMVIGYIKNRKNDVLRFALILFCLEFILMSFVFPFAGSRGGMFHSGSAFQILGWSLIPAGFGAVIDWGVKNRNWKTERAWRMFGSALIAAVILFSGILFYAKVYGIGINTEVWGPQDKSYQQLAREIAKISGTNDAALMIGNPPGYFLASHNEAIAVPEGGVKAVIAAGRDFQVDYLALDKDHPSSLDGVFAQSVTDPGLLFIENFDGFMIYRIIH